MKLLLLCLLLTALAVACQAAEAAEKPVAITDAQLAAAVDAAPPCPHADAMGLSLRLIDYIDCTAADDPHDFMDQGTSSVAEGPAGRYRITAAHRHAFFAYRFRAAGKDKPVLIVIEYPDDADRTINFSTHESGLSGRSNLDWSLESGVYTGDPLPLSNAMQYHTFILWAQDQWPAVLVGNFHRYGHPAAAGRIWVYAIEGPLPPLDVDAPDPDDQRQLGHFNSLGSYLPIRLYFGLKSPQAVEHMLDYYQYVGVNEVSWTVAANSGGVWFDCVIPAWGVTEADLNRNSAVKRDTLAETLEAMDRRDGWFSFAACFNMGGGFRIGDKSFNDMSDAELLAVLEAGFGEFFDRYGRYRSLRKVILGSQYQASFSKFLNQRGLLEEVVAMIKSIRPDIQVGTFIGGPTLHQQYFHGGQYDEVAGATTADVVKQWETSGRPWEDVLGDAALEAWKLWGHDPADWAVEGMTVYDQYQPDDHRIFGLYAQEPRAMLYYDLDWSQRRDEHLDTDHAAMWNTHFEGWYGLHPEVNFWYQKLWVAPDFNAPPPLSLLSYARILTHRDRLAIMPGSWNNKYFGYEPAMRRFARAYRSLPPVTMTDVDTPGLDGVTVRWLIYNDRRYVSVQSGMPFPCEVAVDGTPVALEPFGLAALADDGTDEPVVTGQAPEAYRQWVASRIDRLERACNAVHDLDPAAAPEVYRGVVRDARAALDAGRPFSADHLVGAGLIGELELRRDILARPRAAAPRLAAAPPMNGDLDAWPANATDLHADSGKFLAGHLYFPNSWSGPDNLSARVRIGHDGTNLYIAAAVRDDKLTELDSCQFWLSTNGAYRDWTLDRARQDVTWAIGLPTDEQPVREGVGGRDFTWTCRRIPGGYVVEGSAPLVKLGVLPGQSVGFLLYVQDDDALPNRNPAGWARNQALLVPHEPTYTYYGDARSCGELALEP
ncbi:MAG: hypothetical protein GX591_19800 [Planctomycetes bacterium]|nr:hypothetical protein [Planctomycetota bacterium]